jgi:outer membrane protein assembly factor BamB
MKIPKPLMILWFVCFLFSCKNNAEQTDNTFGNWNIFRGNPALTAYTDVSLPENPVLLWTFRSESNTKSSPVLYNQVAYWSNRRGRIFGVDANGKQVFDYAMETAVDATPMVHNSVLYIGRIDGFLYAICLEKQDTLWTFETWGQIAASPNRMNYNGKNALIVGSYDNYLYVIDGKTGRKINRFESGYYINGAVALSNNYAVFGGCDGWIRVIDVVSGVQTDSLDVGVYIPASPAISGTEARSASSTKLNSCYIADHSGHIYELGLNKGKIVSQNIIMAPKDDNRTHVSVPAVSNKMVYIVSDDRHVYAINRNNGTVAWKYLLKGDTGESSPVICNDKLLVCTRSGTVSILDANTGTLLWEYDTGEQIFASPAVINGCFYILTFRGTLFCFGR